MRARPALVALLLVACGGPSKVAPTAPVAPRSDTAGTELLRLVPAGADAVAEVDLARLRQNPTVGILVDSAPARELMRGLFGVDPTNVDVLVLGAYHAGHKDAATLMLLRGANLGAREDTIRLDERTLVKGPAELAAQALRLAQGMGSSLHAPDLLSLRDEAMPEGAQSASLRVTARLSTETRIAIAGRLGIDGVPRTLSLWMDIADDLALVALMGGDDPDDAERLARATSALAASSLERLLPLSGLRARVVGARTRVVWVVGPAALSRWVRERAGQSSPRTD
jgi:hypothetical protein